MLTNILSVYVHHESFIVFNSLGVDDSARAKVIIEYQFKIEHIKDSPVYLHKYTQ